MSDGSPLDPKSLAAIRRLSGDDDPGFHQRLMRKYIVGARRAYARAKAAAEAGSLEDLRSANHKLLGASGEVGATDLCRLCEMVRQAAKEGWVDTEALRAAGGELDRVVAALEAEFEL